MISQEEGIVSVAQTMLRMRYPNVALGRDEISSVVNECASLLPNGLPEEIKARIISELETRVVINVGKPTRIVDEKGHIPWYSGERKTDRRFFQRYVDFLRQDQGWSQAAIDALDECKHHHGI